MSEKTAENCPVYKKCSGCQLRNMTYPEQLKFKEIKVDRLMGKLCRADKIIGMDSPDGYRHKVTAAFDFIKGKAVSGIYRSATGGVTAVDRCLADYPRADEIVKIIRRTASELGIPFWCSYNKTGFLRQAVIRIGGKTGEIMCVIVGTDSIFPRKKDFVKLIKERCPDITTLIFSVNKSDKLTMGNRTETLFGKGYIEDIICGKRFRISSKSFAQINPVQTEKLYALGIKYAALTGRETVIDAYCGIGTISIIAADKAKAVYGCEINREAVNDAVINAKLNNAENVEFICADSGDFLEEFHSRGLKADVVILDPARAGADKKFLGNLVKISPERIVYISCDPETQARDIFFLIKNGYRLKKLSPVDMFPFTGHVETAALIVKGKDSSVIMK